MLHVRTQSTVCGVYCYFSGIRLLNSDSHTFKIYDKIQEKNNGVFYEAEDKNNYYMDGEIIKKFND
mgnify:CR=1 FL=1